MIENNSGMVGDLIGSKMPSIFGGTKAETIYDGFPIKYFDKLSYLEVVASWFVAFPN